VLRIEPRFKVSGQELKLFLQQLMFKLEVRVYEYQRHSINTSVSEPRDW